ncbi:MAG: pilin [Patescibacteria group bacterium]
MKRKIFFLFLAFSLLIVVSSDFSQASETWDVSALGDYGLPDESIGNIVESVAEWLFGILGIAGVLGFVISGIMYLISAGDDDLAGKAKDAMKYSIYGVIVGLIGFVVIKAVEAMLNAEQF